MSALATAAAAGSVQCGLRRPAAAPAASRLRISAFRPRLGALAASSSAEQAASVRQRQALLTVATYPEPETEKVRIPRRIEPAAPSGPAAAPAAALLPPPLTRSCGPCATAPPVCRSGRPSTSPRSGSRRSPAAARTFSRSLRSCRRRCPSPCPATQRCASVLCRAFGTVLLTLVQQLASNCCCAAGHAAPRRREVCGRGMQLCGCKAI